MRDRREELAHLVLILFGLAAMLQASGFDCVAFDPFSFQQDCLAAPEVDVGWGAQDPLPPLSQRKGEGRIAPPLKCTFGQGKRHSASSSPASSAAASIRAKDGPFSQRAA